MWNLVLKLKNDPTLSASDRQRYVNKLLGTLSDKDVTQPLVADALEFNLGESFRSHINDLRRTKKMMQRQGVKVFPGGNPKLKDREFAEALGVQVPKTYQQNIPLTSVELVPNSILKPVSGSSSRAVFFIDSKCRLRSIRSSKTYQTISEAQPEIETHKSSISSNRWLLEEAVLDSSGEPANDLKVYAFYGRSGLFLEISRQPGAPAKYATTQQDGTQIGLGPKYKRFPGTSLPNDIREISRKLSLAAPVPFTRLDFHLGANGAYLGEITPHPGGTYAYELYDEVDKMLGHYFSEAKARLYTDFLSGKQFPEFHSVYGL